MAQLKSGSTAGGQIIATQDWVTANLIDAAPTALNTLNELAAALGDDPNFATTITNSIATKAPLSGSYGTDFYANALYYDDWVRNHSNSNGIYWSTTGWHLHPGASDWFKLRSGDTSASGIRFNTGGTDRNFIYNDSSNNIGFLNTSGSWIFKVDNAGVLQTGNIPWARLSSVPSTFAPSAHSHAISDVTGLQTALDAKQASGNYLTSLPSHTHDDRYYTETEINNFSYWRDNQDRRISVLRFTGEGGNSGNNSRIAYGIYQEGGAWSHPFPNLRINMHTGMSFGANSGYGGYRFMSDYNTDTIIFSVNDGDANVRVTNNLYIGSAGGWITDLLNGKQAAGSYAAASHTHTIANVTGLQTALDGKQASGSYAAASHTHTISQVTGLQSALDGKQASGSYAAASHEHDRTYITDSRGAARAPSYYNDRYAQWDFQNVADTGVGGDGWHTLLTVSKWSSFDPSHRQEQLIFSGDHLWRRTATSDSAWGDNKKIWDSGNLNPIVGTSYNSSGDIITYTYADGSTTSIDIVDNNSNTYLTGASFNTADGVLTLTRNSGSVTVDLDGRYLESLPGHTHPIAEIDGLQGVLDGKQAAGSYAASNHNHTYNVNDSWLRENGDNNNFRIYGNSRQVIFRTDGTGGGEGHTGYPFKWTYGGDGTGNSVMLLHTDGRLWTARYGWFDTAFAAASHNHDGTYAAASHTHTIANVTGLQSALDGKQAAGSYLTTSGKAADSNLLDGLDLHTGRNNEANKVVRTDVNGYIQAGWINTPSGATTSTLTKIYASQDDYLRYVTPTEFRRQITDGVYQPVGSYAAASHTHSQYLTALPAHDHSISEVRELQAALDAKQAAGSYAASSHTHTASQVGLGNVSNAAQVTTSYNSSLNSDSRNSRGVTRMYRRDSDSDYSVQNHWTGSYWYMRGYSGDSFHAEVQVGYANSAGSASSASSATSATTATNLSGSNVVTSGNNLYIYNSGAENYRLHHNGGGGVFDSHAQFAIRPASTDFPEIRYILNDWVGYFWYNVDPWGDNWGIGPNPYSWAFVNRGSMLTFGFEDWSDRRHKSAITEIDNAVDKVKAISGYTYWKRGSEVKEAGVVAQDVLEVFPEAVGGNEEGYSIKPSALIGLLSKAVKEQQEMIDALTARIEALENK